MTDLSTAGAPAGWYADPWGQASWRWWDGTAWTGYTDAWFAWAVSRPEPGRPIRAGGIAILGVLCGLGLSVAVTLALLVLGVSVDSPFLLLASTAGLWVGLFGACRVAVRRKGTGSLRDIGLGRLRWVDLALGLGFGVALTVAVGMLAAVISELLPELLPRGRSELTEPLSNGGWLGAATILLIAVVGAPFFEELFFRGLVQGTLVARWGTVLGVVTQALLFSLGHLTVTGGWGNVGIVIMISSVGLGLGFIRAGFQRLGPSIATHAVYNAIIVGIALAAS